jgi:outer membrane protein
MRLSVSLISVGLFFVTFAEGAAETMSGALARAYMGNPDLNQQRAGVRATDETLPQASAAWRPTATATGEYGYNYFDLRTSGGAGGSAGGPEARSRQ